MRHISPLLILLASLASFSAAIADEHRAPDFTLTDIDGTDVNLATRVEDKPVVLFFWASWCPYCKALMPHLQSIALEYGTDVEILALHFRDDNDPAAFIEDRHYDFTVLPDAGETAKAFDVHATPGVLVVDRGREVRFNLYEFPRPEVPDDVEDGSHGERGAYLAPYWAAAIRTALDEALAD